MEKRKNFIGITCVVTCQVIFGFSLLFTRTAMDVASPMALLSWRFIVAFAVFNICVLLKLIKVDFKGKSLRPLIVIALFYPFLYFVGETIGVSLTSASESGTVLAATPIGTLICSAVLLKIKPSRLQLLGMATSIVGIVMIVLLRGADAMFNPVGYIMLLFAVISYSLYGVFAQKTAAFTSSEKSYIMAALAAVIFTTAALIESGIQGTLVEFATLPFTSMGFLTSILYLGVGSSVGAFLLYNTAIDNIGANRAISFAGISTIVSITSGVIILQEPFTLLQGAGAVLVIVGVFFANRSQPAKTS